MRRHRHIDCDEELHMVAKGRPLCGGRLVVCISARLTSDFNPLYSCSSQFSPTLAPFVIVCAVFGIVIVTFPVGILVTAATVLVVIAISTATTEYRCLIVTITSLLLQRTGVVVVLITVVAVVFVAGTVVGGVFAY